jgi:hypothetical protein
MVTELSFKGRFPIVMAGTALTLHVLVFFPLISFGFFLVCHFVSRSLSQEGWEHLVSGIMKPEIRTLDPAEAIERLAPLAFEQVLFSSWFRNLCRNALPSFLSFSALFFFRLTATSALL